MENAPDPFEGFFYLTIGLLLMGLASALTGLCFYGIYLGICWIFS
jgi:hypothetical protein